MKSNEYFKQANKFLNEGEKELRYGNLQQASEKFWGAATQAVKAYAVLRGWRHDGHSLLFQNVSMISKEQKDDSFKTQFALAGMLHTNFYENWLTQDEVESYAEAVKQFCKKIKTLLDSIS
jgi:uncharacterized protein (UPF0332 family)